MTDALLQVIWRHERHHPTEKTLEASPMEEAYSRELNALRALFLIAALWNLIGGVPGVVDPEEMFTREFGRVLGDPVHVAVYRGAWGTALLYGFGFLIVAFSPERHTGIVWMGGLGKALFAFNLAYMYLNGWTSNFAVVVILGDIVFVVLFAAYFVRLRKRGIPLL